MRIAMTLICISITIHEIVIQIDNYKHKDTVWLSSEMFKAEILTPIIIFCSEPHNYDLKSDVVYKARSGKEDQNYQIEKLKTAMKVCKIPISRVCNFESAFQPNDKLIRS